MHRTPSNRAANAATLILFARFFKFSRVVQAPFLSPKSRINLTYTRRTHHAGMPRLLVLLF